MDLFDPFSILMLIYQRYRRLYSPVYCGWYCSNIRPYFLGRFLYIGLTQSLHRLIHGRYLQFWILKWPLI